jgi:hypothetical protein
MLFTFQNEEYVSKCPVYGFCNSDADAEVEEH